MKRKNKNKTKMLMMLALMVGVAGIFVFPGLVFGATGINKQINFQGKVVNTNGTNVSNGNYDFVFKLYSVSSGGTAIWTETWNSGTSQVTVTDGVFQVNLGTHTTLPGSVDFNTDNIYLGIEFNADGEMSPRVRFTAAPYAFNADKVHGLTVTDTTGTLTIPNGETISFGGSFTTSASNDVTLTTSGATNVTLPTTGTLTTLDGNETFTNKTIGSTGLTFSGAATDITTASGESLVIVAAGAGTVDIQDALTADSLTLDNGSLTLQNSEVVGNGTDDIVTFVGAGGADNTDLYLDLDGTSPVLYSNTDVRVSVEDFLNVQVSGVTGAAAGDIWYDSAANKFKINENGTTKIICNTTDLGCGSGGSLTVRESDASPSVSSVTTLEFGPASTSSDEFIVTDQTGGVARIIVGTQVGKLNEAETVSGGWTFNTASTTFTTAIDVNTTSTIAGLTVDSGSLTLSGLATDITTGSGESLVIVANGAGTVDIQDATTVDSLTTDTGGVSIASGQAYTGAGAVIVSSGGSGALTIDSASGTITTQTDDDIIPTLGAGDADLGSSGTRWDNVYATNGNFTALIVNGTTDPYVDEVGDTMTGALVLDPTAAGTFLDFVLETQWTAGDLINADWGSAITQTAALTGLNLDFTNLTSVAGSTTYGFLINDLAAQTTSTEYAIYQEGTNWDYGLYVEDAAHFNAAVAISGSLAANGGITFDAASDTVGAHTLSGTINANGNILENIGNSGTDFIASTGALTLAGVLTANGGISLSASQSLSAAALSYVDLGLITHSTTANQGLRLPNAASATPSSPTSGEGYIAWDSAGNQVIVYNGSAWTTLSGGSTTWNTIGAPTGALSLTFDAGETSAFAFNGFTTETGFALSSDAGITSGELADLTVSAASGFTGNVLDINLSDGTGAASNTGSLLRLTNSGTANANTTALINHYATGSGNLALRINDVTSDTTPFVVDGTGAVGIGTTTPSGWFDIYNSGADVVSTITAADTTYDPIIKFRTGSSPAVQFTLGVDNTDADKFKIYSGDGLGGGDEFTIDASGVTSIANLNLGNTTFDADAGIVSWVDMPVTSGAAVDTVESYAAQVDGSSILTVYAESNGSGGIQDRRVVVGTGTAMTTVPTLLSLDVKSDSGDPTGFEGAMYYNDNTNVFRCYQNTGWTNCIGSGGSADLQTTYGNDADAGNATISLTAADDGLVFTNPTSGGTDGSAFLLQLNQQNTTAIVSVVDIIQASNAANAVNVTANAIDAETGVALTMNALTSGKGLSIESSSNGLTTNGALAYYSYTGSSSTGAIFRVDDVASDTTPFVVDPSGNVGIGTASPARALDIVQAASAPQLRLSKDLTNYSEFTVDSVGDLQLAATGTDIRALSENLWICDNDACPALTLTGDGNIFVENVLKFGNGVYLKNDSATELGVYDNDNQAMLIFDEL